MFFNILQLFELEECAFHINGVEIDKDLNGDQINMLVVGIRTKKTAKERTKKIYIHGVIISGFGGNCGEKMDICHLDNK